MQPILVNGPTDKRINIVFFSEGYTASQFDQFTSKVNQTLNYMLNTQPFHEYSNYFNAYAIYVASNEPGSDHPWSGIYKDTYFNSSYDSHGIQRLITIPPNDYNSNYNAGKGKVYALLQSLMPEYDMIVLIVNDGEYGGSGGQISITSVHSYCPEVMVHEVAHSFGHVGDEYESPYPGFPDIEYPNTTKETRREYIRWGIWILETTPIPTPELGQYATVVGLFEGAHYYSTGWYRPKLDCKMRSIGAPFCEVCSEAQIKSIYSSVNSIDSYTPETTSISLEDTASVTLSVTPKYPLTHSLSVQWYENGNPIPGETLSTYAVYSPDLGNGHHTIRAEVNDGTSLVRNDPSGLLYDFIDWNINVTGLPQEYYVIQTVYDDHGSFYPTGPYYVSNGGSQQFTISTDTCYIIDELYVDDVHVDSTTSYTFENVTSDHILSLTTKIKTFTVSVTYGEHGTISPNGAIDVNCGESRAFSILPDSGYGVDSIFVDGMYVPDSTTSYTFNNITSDHTINAQFIRVIKYNFIALSGVHGVIVPQGVVYVDSNLNQMFIFIPDVGCHIDSLYVDDIYLDTTTNSYTFYNINQNHTIRVTFDVDVYTINASSGEHGAITPQGIIPVTYNSDAVFTFQPEPNYHIDSLFIDDLYIDTVTFSYTFYGVKHDHSIYVTFGINSYQLSVSTVGNGSVLKIPDQPGYEHGTSIQLLAQPSVGYHFTSWGGDLISNENPDTIIMDGSKTVTAYFTINIYAIDASAGPNGSINPSGTVTIKHGNDTTFQFHPDPKYHFDSLMVDNVLVPDSIKTYTFHGVNSGHWIHATFKANIKPLPPLIDTLYSTDTTSDPNDRTLHFHWHPSADPDIDDTLRYTMFVLSEFSSSVSYDTTLQNILDTCVSLNLTSLLVDISSIAWTITVTDGHDTVASRDTSRIIVTGITNGEQSLPTSYYLHQNFSNPFNPVTRFEYQLPVESIVTLKIYNVLGQMVVSLVDGIELAGYKSIDWNASGNASGVYFYRLEAISVTNPSKTFTQVKKMLLVK